MDTVVPASGLHVKAREFGLAEGFEYAATHRRGHAGDIPGAADDTFPEKGLRSAHLIAHVWQETCMDNRAKGFMPRERN
jgi:hypothetical protein